MLLINLVRRFWQPSVAVFFIMLSCALAREWSAYERASAAVARVSQGAKEENLAPHLYYGLQAAQQSLLTLRQITSIIFDRTDWSRMDILTQDGGKTFFTSWDMFEMTEPDGAASLRKATIAEAQAEHVRLAQAYRESMPFPYFMFVLKLAMVLASSLLPALTHAMLSFALAYKAQIAFTVCSALVLVAARARAEEEVFLTLSIKNTGTGNRASYILTDMGKRWGFLAEVPGNALRLGAGPALTINKRFFGFWPAGFTATGTGTDSVAVSHAQAWNTTLLSWGRLSWLNVSRVSVPLIRNVPLSLWSKNVATAGLGKRCRFGLQYEIAADRLEKRWVISRVFGPYAKIRMRKLTAELMGSLWPPGMYNARVTASF